MEQMVELRQELSLRLGVPETRLVGKLLDNGASFKRAIGAELLSRRGLTRPEIARVLDLSRRGVDEALAHVRERMESRAFKQYLSSLETRLEDYYTALIVNDY